MAKTRFFLKDPKGDKPTLVYLFFSFNSNRLKYSTGEMIHPKYWNNDKAVERAINSKKFPEYPEFNQALNDIETLVNNIHRRLKNDGHIPTVEMIRDELDKNLGRVKVGTNKSFLGYLDEYIEITKVKKRANTIKKFNALKTHLVDFQKIKRFKLSFGKIDMSFFEKFENYLMTETEDKPSLVDNSIGKYIAALKAFLNWTVERELNANLKFQKFPVYRREADIIYLTELELMKLYEFDLSQKKHLERIRDAFCFGCFTGLRYSDYAQITSKDIKEDSIKIRSVKTKDFLNVPLNDYAIEILEKYNYQLPVVANQPMNRAVKEIGEMAGIDTPVIITKLQGGKTIETQGPKYELLSTHCGRRTFVTLSLEKGMRPETVMSITGHKDYQTFKKYVKITDKVKKVEMNRVWKKPETALKAV